MTEDNLEYIIGLIKQSYNLSNNNYYVQQYHPNYGN